MEQQWDRPVIVTPLGRDAGYMAGASQSEPLTAPALVQSGIHERAASQAEQTSYEEPPPAYVSRPQ